MKNKILGVALVAFALASCGSVRCVQTSGMYRAGVDAETFAYIRFYSDKNVIVTTSVEKTTDVFTWFNKENKDRVLKGKFKIRKDCTFNIKVKGDTGEQQFDGKISGTKIEVQIYDPKQKAATIRTYEFVAE